MHTGVCYIMYAMCKCVKLSIYTMYTNHPSAQIDEKQTLHDATIKIFRCSLLKRASQTLANKFSDLPRIVLLSKAK